MPSWGEYVIRLWYVGAANFVWWKSNQPVVYILDVSFPVQ